MKQTQTTNVKPNKLPYNGTHHKGGYHSQQEVEDDLLGLGKGDFDNPPGEWKIRPMSDKSVQEMYDETTGCF